MDAEYRKGMTDLRDLFFSYLAYTDLHLLALERVLQEKNIIVSREEIEKKYQTLVHDDYDGLISTYDSLLPKRHEQMLAIRKKLGEP